MPTMSGALKERSYILMTSLMEEGIVKVFIWKISLTVSSYYGHSIATTLVVATFLLLTHKSQKTCTLLAVALPFSSEGCSTPKAKLYAVSKTPSPSSSLIVL